MRRPAPPPGSSALALWNALKSRLPTETHGGLRSMAAEQTCSCLTCIDDPTDRILCPNHLEAFHSRR